MRARLIKKAAIVAAKKEVRRLFAKPAKGNCLVWFVTKDFRLRRLEGRLSSDKRLFITACGNYPALMVNSQVFRSAQEAKRKAESLRTIAEKRMNY